MLPKEEFKSIKNSTKSPILGDKHFQRDFGVNLLNGISQIPAKKRGWPCEIGQVDVGGSDQQRTRRRYRTCHSQNR